MGFKMRYLVAGMLCLASCWAQAADDWQLAKDENGIKVYLRAVPGSPYKAYRGVTVIDTDMQTLRRLMENAAEACSWIHECKEQKLLRHEERQAWTYTRFNTPWPVTPRDSVVHITEYEKRDGVIRPLKNSASTAPTRSGCRFFKRLGLTEAAKGLDSGLFDRFSAPLLRLSAFFGRTSPYTCEPRHQPDRLPSRIRL
ncbi:MAG: START domain-containing protein [Pigmentiphaga sp.]